MAGQSLIDFIMDFAIGFVPLPMIGLGLIIIFGAYMMKSRIPLSAGGHLTFILIFGLSAALGGFFTSIFEAFMWGAAVVALALGILKMSTR